MSQPIGDALDNPYVGIIVVVVAVVVVVVFRLYMMRSGGMRAKCPKCGAVFDASHSFSGVHLGPFRMLQCPACGKSSFMNSYVKDPLTWPDHPTPAEQSSQLSDEELERRHIEESKYEDA
jgi:ribosomal protein S27AE